MRLTTFTWQNSWKLHLKPRFKCMNESKTRHTYTAHQMLFHRFHQKLFVYFKWNTFYSVTMRNETSKTQYLCKWNKIWRSLHRFHEETLAYHHIWWQVIWNFTIDLEWCCTFHQSLEWYWIFLMDSEVFQWQTQGDIHPHKHGLWTLRAHLKLFHVYLLLRRWKPVVDLLPSRTYVQSVNICYWNPKSSYWDQQIW